MTVLRSARVGLAAHPLMLISIAKSGARDIGLGLGGLILTSCPLRYQPPWPMTWLLADGHTEPSAPNRVDPRDQVAQGPVRIRVPVRAANKHILQIGL